jgi:hypothetical protein
MVVPKIVGWSEEEAIMVQVDVFWSYGLGSSFALAASRQLAEEKRHGRGVLESPYFTKTVLFLAVLFAPSGAWLLWAFPSWETMHAGTRDLPAWLVSAFAATNVTQGALGFFVVAALAARRRLWSAWLHWFVAYFAMFFILVHGWDGRGYQRFFSFTRADFLAWHGDWIGWLTSPVAFTLYGMGVVLVPTILYLTASWITAAEEPSARRSKLVVALLGLTVVFGCGLGSAILCSLAIHALGWIAGSLIFAAVLWLIALRPGGIYRRLFALLFPSAD